MTTSMMMMMKNENGRPFSKMIMMPIIIIIMKMNEQNGPRINKNTRVCSLIILQYLEQWHKQNCIKMIKILSRSKPKKKFDQPIYKTNSFQWRIICCCLFFLRYTLKFTTTNVCVYVFEPLIEALAFEFK